MVERNQHHDAEPRAATRGQAAPRPAAVAARGVRGDRLAIAVSLVEREQAGQDADRARCLLALLVAQSVKRGVDGGGK